MNSYQLSKAEPEIQGLVNRIAKMAGMDRKIEVFATTAPYACSTYFKEDTDQIQRPVLIYNPVFIEQITTSHSWAVVAVFAHEIAGFYNNNLYETFIDHFSDKKFNYKAAKVEIRVDHFTGWVLWHEGARLKEAMDLYKLPRFKDGFSADPEKNERAKAMRTGWIKAYYKAPGNRKVKPKRKQNPPSGSKEEGTDQKDTDNKSE